MDEKILWNFTYGMYVVDSKIGNKINAQLSNTVFQTTAEPPQVAFCISKTNYTHQFIEESKKVATSVVSTEWTMIDIGNFGFRSGRNYDKFKKYQYKLGKNGTPIILHKTLGYVEADVTKAINLGSHTLFTARVTEGELFNPTLEPMTYKYYHEKLKGKEPETSPLYRKGTDKQSKKKQ